VRIEGHALFRLTTEPVAIASFYRRYGVRTFDGLHPYDGDDGWQSFLAIPLRPVLDNALREAIGRYRAARQHLPVRPERRRSTRCSSSSC
jgi:hypothetical protein